MCYQWESFLAAKNCKLLIGFNAGKDCSKFEFECRNTGQPLAYPQCVAIYNKCDGISLCKDSSDEADCDVKGKCILYCIIYQLLHAILYRLRCLYLVTVLFHPSCTEMCDHWN